MTDDGTPTRTHDQFDVADSDIVIQSADGVLFQLHRKNLEVNTGAFPGAEFSTEGEPVMLTEPEDVLAIVFQFIYPRKHPKLRNLEFKVVLAVAEAVEKYEVFSAMHTCEGRLREFLPKHADDVFIHAIKHGNLDLIEETALILTRPSSLNVELLDKLPSHCLLPWIKYQQEFKNIFDGAIQYIEESPSSSHCEKRPGRKFKRDLCRLCRFFLTIWVRDLEKSDSVSSLKAVLQSPSLNSKFPRNTGEWCDHCAKDKCTHFAAMVSICKVRMDAIPPFTDFLNPKNVILACGNEEVVGYVDDSSYDDSSD